MNQVEIQTLVSDTLIEIGVENDIQFEVTFDPAEFKAGVQFWLPSGLNGERIASFPTFSAHASVEEVQHAALAAVAVIYKRAYEQTAVAV